MCCIAHMDLEEQVAILKEQVADFNNQVSELKEAFETIQSEHEDAMNLVLAFHQHLTRQQKALEYIAEQLARKWNVPVADVLWM
jgi:peptidoglycan hydrolase CwlO-like protein